MITATDRQMAIDLINEAVTAGARCFKACEILGISLRTLQRWKKHGLTDGRTLRQHEPANKLSAEERQHVVAIANSKEFQSMSPKQIVPILADRGEYIASESSFYRILREEDMMHHRGRSAAPSSTPEKPVGYSANAANQVWSWDITYCATTVRGIFYYLYLIMDVYSRKIVGWAIHEDESSNHAAVMLNQAYLDEQVKPNQVVLHSDNGSPMKGATMLATLQKLGVVPSFSRPSVSNDNPYSESLFKTLKYHPTYPDKPFANLDAAEQWVQSFVTWYNYEHRHSSLRYVTPIQRHSGEDKVLLQRRTEVYRQAKEQNPARWVNTIRDWSHQGVVWLNPSQEAKNDNLIVEKKVS